jgi:bacillolysin
VRSKDPTRWDESGDAAGAAVDAHAYVAATWDHFARVHGRLGWDGKNKGVHATVHFGRRYANAFFDGRQLAFGDGDGASFAPLAGALDVVAHEYAHGVTFHTARLGTEGETGALNEALSDIFGCFVEGNWQIGEAVYRPAGSPQPLRDVERPHETNNPESMEEYVDTGEDNGGVHVNSTIVSHAAYLMTVGPHRLPPRMVEKIWYRALTRYLHAAADFGDAADATLAAARDLGGNVAETTVDEAWAAVGVVQ